VTPSCPGTTLATVATPRNVAAFFHAAGVLGIRPSELSPLGEPCRLQTAFCSLAGSVSTSAPARRPRRSPTAFTRAPDPGRRSFPCGGVATREGLRELPAIVISGRPVLHASASCPATAHRPGTTDRNLRASPAVADPPASKPCSPRESVRRSTAPLAEARAPRLAPRALRPTGPLLSWVFAPSEPSPPRLGFGRLRVAPGANRTLLGRPRPAPDTERGASILRPRPSGTSGVAGWPPERSTVGRTRARPRHLSAAPLPLLPFACVTSA
jgi:hypothetical protein